MIVLDKPRGPSFGSSGVSVLDSQHSQNWRMDWTAHPFQKVLVILGGTGALQGKDFSWPLQRRIVAYIPERWPYRLIDTPSEPLSLFVVFLEARVFGRHKDLGLEPRPHMHSGYAFCSDTRKRVQEMLFEQSAAWPGSQAKLRGLAWQLIGDMLRERSNRTPSRESAPVVNSLESRVRYFVADLDETFCRPQSLQSIAKRLQMSKRSLSNAFRKVTGCSVIQYTRRLRVDYAKRLLLHSDRSVISIAFECGFESSSNFHRAFKAATGLPPEQWKRAMLEQKAGQRDRLVS